MTSRPLDSSRESRASAARFEAWVRAHHAAVYRSAWRITRNGADAEDVAQQVFLQVLERIARPEWSDVADPGPRLRWLAVKTALGARRGEANRRRREEVRAMETSEVDARGADPARNELIAQLRDGVARLPEELRVATVLRFQEGLTFAAMAELAGTSEPTMFERVKRALEKLRVALAQAGHAGALVELESLLAVEESVAVPGKLCATLLALPAAGTVGVATGAAATATASTSTSTWLAAAAAAVVLIGGGAAAVHVVRANRAIETSEAGAASVHAASERTAPSAAVAPATAEPARVVDSPSANPAAPHDGRVRAPELLRGFMGISPGDEWNERWVETAHLRGVVVDDDGRTLSGVTIEASSNAGATKAFAWHAAAQSGADGAFDLRVAAVTPEPQPYVLGFAHADMLARQLEATVKPNETTDLARVELRRNAADRAGDFELTLRVVDPAGKAVPNADVRMFRKLAARPTGVPGQEGPPRFEWQAGGVTDERGAVLLAASRLGEKLFEIEARAAGLRDLAVELRVDSAGASEQVVALEPGLTLAGRLIPPAGRDVGEALEGAQVDAIALDTLDHEEDGTAAAAPFAAEIAADGGFVVRSLAPGRYRLRVRGDFSPAWIDDLEAGRGDLVLRLKLRDDPSDAGVHRAEIHGRIVDESGAPLAVDEDAVVAIALPAGWSADDPRVFSEYVPQLLHPSGQTAQELIRDPAERPAPSSTFHRVDLDAGNYLIFVNAPGRATAVSQVVTVGRNGIARDVVVAFARTK